MGHSIVSDTAGADELEFDWAAEEEYDLDDEDAFDMVRDQDTGGWTLKEPKPGKPVTKFLGGRLNLVKLLSLVAMQMGGAVAGHFLLQLK